VDTKRFAHSYTEADVAGMKESLGKKDGDVYLVTTSRLVHKNAVDDVIAALAHMPKNVSFLIYGIGPDEAKLRALAASLGVADRVRFMGEIGHETMPLMLAACDVFVRPSRSEGMGNSFVEAMAAGLPERKFSAPCGRRRDSWTSKPVSLRFSGFLKISRITGKRFSERPAWARRWRGWGPRNSPASTPVCGRNYRSNPTVV
jgi:hypothetical protein